MIIDAPNITYYKVVCVLFILVSSLSFASLTDTQAQILLSDSDGDGFLDGPDVWQDGILQLSECGFGWRGLEIKDPGTKRFQTFTYRDYSPTDIHDKSEHPNTPSIYKDTDGDGLPDFAEDFNQNGKYDLEPYYLKSEDRNVQETDFRDADTDDDGLSDGYEAGLCALDTLFLVHDKKTRDLNPLDPDTDHDGLPDGLELGLKSPADGVRRWLAFIGSPPIKDTNLKATFKHKRKTKDGWVTIERPCFIPDADPESLTDPTRADTNIDGVPDGEQDVNINGRCDPGETSASAGFVYDQIYGDPQSIFMPVRNVNSLSLLEYTYQTPTQHENITDTLRISDAKSLKIKHIRIYPGKRYWGCLFIYSPEEEKDQEFSLFSIAEGYSITKSNPDEDIQKLVDLWERNHITTIPPRRNFIMIHIQPKETFRGSVRIYDESPEFLNGKTPSINLISSESK